jgi:hypothetical protein
MESEEPPEFPDACPDPECARTPTDLSPKLPPMPLAGKTNLQMINIDGLPVTLPDTPPVLDVPEVSGTTGGLGAPDVPKLPEEPNLPGAPTLPDLPTLPQVPINSAGLPSLGLPNDITGALPAPDTPTKRVRARGMAKRGVQKSIRMGRRAALRKPVLYVILGRQLGKPTHSALKLISKGIDVVIPDIQGAAPVAAPLPVPPVPIPT